MVQITTVLLPNTSLFVTGISPFSLAIQLNQMKAFKARVLELGPSEQLPSSNIFGKSLYTLYIGQNDFTSNLAAIGISGVQQYLPQVAAQIVGTIQVSTLNTPALCEQYHSMRQLRMTIRDKVLSSKDTWFLVSSTWTRDLNSIRLQLNLDSGRPRQIQEYAEELTHLSKGTMIDIKSNNTIVFYGGKNYVQPKVMSPPDTLSKNKALEKSKYEQSLEQTSQFIEKLEKELEEYRKHIEWYKKNKEAVSNDSRVSHAL
ncbi:hypothetical protein IFM89_029416 [Coptis chinensis]|uniref:Uncharacterized protein n=1 Tax=Coptis chinensis TaxID=261450 RepID=A0A835MA72_9MAGN|nr:hypothetical protein IFM89_029416 [Coptis chinensis]